MALFERGGLENDTGLLKERWGQDGSELVNLVYSGHVDTTLHTVTAGKRLFIKTITVTNGSTTSGGASVKDGGSGGTVKAGLRVGNTMGTYNDMTFDSPLFFDTDVYMDMFVGGSINVTITGWEE